MQSNADTHPIPAPHDRCGDCRLFRECPIRDVANGETGCTIQASSRVLEKGDHVFRTGDVADCVHFVKSGALKAYLLCPAGEEQVVAFYFPGDLIGLESMGFPNEALCIEALSLCRVCALPREEVMELCTRSRSVMRRLFVQASFRLRFDASLFAMLGRKSADQRVAAFLLELARRLTERDAPILEFELKMTRADIASYLALAVETVSRVLTRLQDNGAIEVERSRRVCIVDIPAMDAVAGNTPTTQTLWSTDNPKKGLGEHSDQNYGPVIG